MPEGAMEELGGPGALLAEWTRRGASAGTDDGLPPARLPLVGLVSEPALFQPRGTKAVVDERHVQELARALKLHGDLEPVLVTTIGSEVVLIDGHHRLAAYRQEKAPSIPVRHFAGTVAEAVLEAGKANSRAKLPMTTQERQNYAWRLVLMGEFSRKQIVEAAAVADGQVSNMRRVAKALGLEASTCPTWAAAQRLAKGRSIDPMSDGEREAWLEVQANQYADRLAKTFSTKLAGHPEIAARAFSIYFGRQLRPLARALEEYVGAIEDDPEEDF